MPELIDFLPKQNRVDKAQSLIGDPTVANNLGFDAFRQRLELLRGFTPNNRPDGLDSDFNLLGLFLDASSGLGGGAAVDPTDGRIHLEDRNKLFTHPTAPNAFTGIRPEFLELIDAMTEAGRRNAINRRSQDLNSVFSGTPLNP